MSDSDRRVGMVDDGQATGDIKNLFDAARAMLGRVPNSYRVLARVPQVSKFLIMFNAVIQREGAGSLLSTRIKEMVVIKTSHINACSY
ncbi:MAG: hypothetical protein OXH94_05395 [Rhodospirillales bacterium]|nr:hypothetical protein [Rhodospirillales bacterium]